MLKQLGALVGRLLGGEVLNDADTGSLGEKSAREFLVRERGFVVVAVNWRSPRDRRDEIDLVCRDGEVLVFIEVKTRADGALVPGYYAVDKRKKTVLRRACADYLRGLKSKPTTFRFDVVEVTTFPSKALPEVLHFENVELFSKHFRP